MVNATSCRVLVLDDELKFGLRLAKELSEVDSRLLDGCKLNIELSNNAYFVASKLAQSPEAPPWDLILADIFMPPPSRRPDGKLLSTAEERERCEGSFCCKSYEYEYHWSKYQPTAMHGGIVVAAEIARQRRSHVLAGLRLVLTSGLLSGTEKRNVEVYINQVPRWCEYYDKATWEGHSGSAHLLSTAVFKWAVIYAIKDWRDRPTIQGGLEQRLPLITLSTRMQDIAVRGRQIVENLEDKCLFISGPVGSGKKILAETLMERRAARVGATVSRTPIACRDLREVDLLHHLDSVARPHLITFEDVVDLTPRIQEIVEKKLNSLTGGDLFLFLSRSSVLELGLREREAFLTGSLLKIFLSNSLVIPALKDRREDIPGIAAAAIQACQPGLRIANDALDWLSNQEWEYNGLQLAAVSANAARNCTSPEVGHNDVQEAYDRVLLDVGQTAKRAPSRANHSNETGRHRTLAQKKDIVHQFDLAKRHLSSVWAKLQSNPDLTAQELEILVPGMAWNEGRLLDRIVKEMKADIENGRQSPLNELAGSVVHFHHGIGHERVKQFRREIDALIRKTALAPNYPR